MHGAKKKHKTLYGLWLLTGTKLRISCHQTSSLSTTKSELLSLLYGLNLILFKTVSLKKANGSMIHTSMQGNNNTLDSRVNK